MRLTFLLFWGCLLNGTMWFYNEAHQPYTASLRMYTMGHMPFAIPKLPQKICISLPAHPRMQENQCSPFLWEGFWAQPAPVLHPLHHTAHWKTCELSGVSWKKVSGSLCLWTGAFSAFSLKYIFSISNLLIVNHGRSTAFQNSLLWLKHFLCMFSTLSLHPLSLITDNSSDKRAFLWWLVAVSKQA